MVIFLGCAMSLSRKPRTLRRAEARVVSKDIKDRERLARLEVGGAPERPIEVVSASLVEPRARGAPCALCGGNVRVDDHTAKTVNGAPLRLAHIVCPMCGYARILYFAIRPSLVN